MLSVVDQYLSKEYQQMVGFYNIINNSNNTILIGDVTFLSSLTTSSISTFYQSVSINSNFYNSANIYLINDVTCLSNLAISGKSYFNNDLIINGIDSLGNKNGVYVNLAVPPGTPQSSSLLRISLSAAHTEADINILLKAFSDLKSNQQELISKMSSRLTK